jgi:hypothetical protein
VVVAKLLVATWCAAAGPSAVNQGVVTGTVVNASRGNSPVADAEVVLRVRLGEQFVPFHETKTDASGRFRFNHLPVGKEYSFLPGANRDGVHYPGPRLEVLAQQPWVSVELVVYDSVAEPSPLVIRRQEIALRPEPGALRVTESILVENPTSQTYVGRARHEGWEPVTLGLAIPSDFERTTFNEEFFGRRFSIFDGRLVTGIAWPPGQRELKFAYVVPNKSAYYCWKRPIDLPCSELHVRIENAKPSEVTCGLHRGDDAANGILTFDSAGSSLPAGHLVTVQFGRLPVPFMARARWFALLALLVLVTGTSLIFVRRRIVRRATANA